MNKRASGSVTIVPPIILVTIFMAVIGIAIGRRFGKAPDFPNIAIRIRKIRGYSGVPDLEAGRKSSAASMMLMNEEGYEMPFFNFLLYLLVSLLMLGIGLLLFTVTTKVREFRLIGEGNRAAAMVLGGKMMGLSFVLGSSIANSVSILDMILWGLIGMAAQILIYPLAEMVTFQFNIHKAIEEDNQAVGFLLLFISLSIGWIIANNLTY